MSKNKAAVMAELFDIDDDVQEKEKSSTSEAVSVSGPDPDPQDFAQKCKDMKLITGGENQEKSEPEEKPLATEAVIKKIEAEETEETNILGDSQDPIFLDNPDNPLDLSGDDYEYFKMLKDKYGNKFDLYNGNSLMKRFYCYKVRELGYILSKVPLIDCDPLMNEIENIDTNHSIRGIPHPEILAEKLNAIMQQRERMSEILLKIYKRFYLWDNALDMLKGVLWTVKEVKGAHKRDGIVMEYLSDVIHYVIDLKAVEDAGKYIDHLLCSSHESISRQVSITENQRSRKSMNYEEFDKKKESFDKTKNISDGLETIDEGTSIESPPAREEKNGATDINGEVNFGISDKDKFSDIG